MSTRYVFVKIPPYLHTSIPLYLHTYIPPCTLCYVIFCNSSLHTTTLPAYLPTTILPAYHLAPHACYPKLCNTSLLSLPPD